MKKIGIITINYNNLEGLKKTFNSINNQKFQGFEYIVVDGNSTDGSAEYILKNKETIDKCLIEDDRGIYDALNKGIELCDAEYILALNSGDTLIDEEVLERVQKEIDELKESIGVIYGKSVYLLDDEEIGWTWPSIEGELDDKEWINSFSPHHQAAFINKKVYSQEKYNIAFKSSGDGEFWKRLKNQNIKFQYFNQKISYFDLGGISNSSSLKVMNTLASEKAIIEYMYDKKSLLKSFFKNYIKQIIKFLYRKIRNQKKGYLMQRDNSKKNQKKYKRM